MLQNQYYRFTIHVVSNVSNCFCCLIDDILIHIYFDVRS